MDKRKKWLLAGCIVISGVAAAVWLKGRMEVREPIRVLERNPPGGGDEEFQMELRTEMGNFPVNFRLAERSYREDEMEAVFEQGVQWLEDIWLGENTSAQAVTDNLCFPTRIDELGLEIHWETENYRWIHTDGTLTEEARETAPLDTTVRAVLSYGDAEHIVDYPVRIVTPEKDEKTAFRDSITEVLDNLQAEQRTASELALPERIGEVSLSWHDRQNPIWSKILIFGNICMVLLYFQQEERKLERVKAREEGLRRDYPEIVYRLVLLIGSGMTVRAAWEKVIIDYQKWRERTGESRWGYEEMEMALREMNYGIPELKAYESFGKRCGTQGYIRLSSLLIQQVKRGARGMNSLLAQEVGEAEVLRRENARKSAEEAGTRLILPMILLMTVVFAVLMIPAFLSMNL